MSLHAAIMNLPDGIQPEGEGDVWCRGFKFGHRAARRQAAELAIAHDAEVERFRDALTGVVRNFPTDGDMHEAGWTLQEIEAACAAHDVAVAALKEPQ